MSKLGQNAHPLLFIVSAPAGTGKSTLVERLVAEFSNEIVETCSVTTRRRRSDEQEGKHYTFVTRQAFLKKVNEGAFLEHVEVYGNLYGTLASDVDLIIKRGKHAVLVIDTKGAAEILKKNYRSVSIFLVPPSVDELHRRLTARGTEDEEEIQRRLSFSEEELKAVGNYHYQIINDDLERAYLTLKSIVIAETHKVKHFI